MISAPKTIIISGTGRNVGKTTYALNLIKLYSQESPIAIKISSHFHKQTNEVTPIIINDNYRVYKQELSDSNKDSSLMLKAGAELVYYIEAVDKFLPEIIELLSQEIAFDDRIIIESAAIRRYIKPQDFILVYSNEFPNMKSSNVDLEKYISSRINIIDK